MEIIEYKEQFNEEVKNLLIELQQHIVNVDDLKLQILNKEYKEKYFKNLLNEINNKFGKIYLAVEGNCVLGFIAGTINTTSGEDLLTVKKIKSGRVNELCVTTKLRGKHIGSLLINKMEDYFKENNCEYIYIEVFAPNESAYNFYIKNNYKTRSLEVIKKL